MPSPLIDHLKFSPCGRSGQCSQYSVIPTTGSKFFSSHCWGRLWGPYSSLFSGYCGCILGVSNERYHSTCTSAEGKNRWSYVCTPPVCFPWYAHGQHYVFNISLKCHSHDCTEHSTLFWWMPVVTKFPRECSWDWWWCARGGLRGNNSRQTRWALNTLIETALWGGGLSIIFGYAKFNCNVLVNLYLTEIAGSFCGL